MTAVAAPVASAFYEGRTRHQRFSPKAHRFEFALWLALLDADQPDGPESVFAPGQAAHLGAAGHPVFRREDYLDGDATCPLGDAVRALVGERSGRAPTGPVRTLTQVRGDRYVFNPITVHYCLAADTGEVEVIVLEVTNTPWKERHYYVIDVRPADEQSPAGGGAIRGTVDERGRIHARFPKQLHVSPFLTTDEEYWFSATAPGERLWLALENHRQTARGDERVFRADVSLERRAGSVDELRRLARRHRFQTHRVWAGIHLQAAALAAKRVPFQPHPGRQRP